MVAKCGTLLLLLSLLLGCAVVQTPPITGVALLAPFEGRYREVGYDLLYAARLALEDGGYTSIDLLPVDDGGSVDNAVDRARALVHNPSVKIVLIAGYPAADTQVQQAFADMPRLIVGHWGAAPEMPDAFVLASRDLSDAITAPERLDVLAAAALSAPPTGGEAFALKQFPLLRDDLSGITIASNAVLPSSEFSQRYLASDLYVPPPGLLTTLAYDATHIAAQALEGSTERNQVVEHIRSTSYIGLNGLITFRDGYWHDAPIIRYVYNTDATLKRE